MIRSTSWRRVAIVLIAGSLVLGAGCAGLDFGGSEPAPDETTTQTDTGSDGQETTEAETTTAESTTEAETTTTESTTTATTTSDGDAQNGTETEGSDSDGTLDGEMSVVIAGNELSYDGVGSEDEGFWFAGDGEYRKEWHANASTEVTLAEALAAFGVNASAETLTYDGETYAQSDEGVSLNYRVNGEPVAPTEYTLADGDEVWVTVETPTMNVSVPGDHIDHDVSHIHGTIDFVVNGSEVDFSRDKYQAASHQRHFHFEGGEASPWHAHSWSVTLAYAMGTLEGISVGENQVTYENTTYDGSDAGTNVTIRVNGEPVTPDEYFLKDGDHVEIVVETEDDES